MRGFNIINNDNLESGCLFLEEFYYKNDLWYKIYLHKNRGVLWDIKPTNTPITILPGKNSIELIEAMNIPYYIDGEIICKECLKNRILNKDFVHFYIPYDKLKCEIMKETIKKEFDTEIKLLYENNRVKCKIPYCQKHSKKIKDRILEIIHKSIYNNIFIMQSLDLNELELEDIICNNLSLIEPGMTLIKRQYVYKNTRFDILAKDKNNKLCIIELKVNINDKSILYQVKYYPKIFNGSRMIVLAPTYRDHIADLLLENNVELKQFHINQKHEMIIQDWGKVS